MLKRWQSGQATARPSPQQARAASVPQARMYSPDTWHRRCNAAPLSITLLTSTAHYARIGCSSIEQQGSSTCVSGWEQRNERQASAATHSHNRRLLLGLLAGALCLALSSPLPASAAPAALPKAYQEVVRQAAASLRDSIQADQEGKKETEVRRKADPAKEALQQFVRKWRDDRRVVGHPSHTEVLAVMSELGAFYQVAGPRARLPSDVQARLLLHVNAAEAALTQAPGPGPDAAAPSPPQSRLPGSQENPDEAELRLLLPS